MVIPIDPKTGGTAPWPSGNRSVAVVISHLVLDQAMDFWEALEIVAAARGRVLGSGSFPLQLLRLLVPQPEADLQKKERGKDQLS